MSGETGMKVHKVVLIIVDHDRLGADGVRDEINNMNYPNDCMSPHIISIETKDIGEWTDEHPINRDIKSESAKLFPATPPGYEMGTEAKNPNLLFYEYETDLILAAKSLESSMPNAAGRVRWLASLLAKTKPPKETPNAQD